jgi:hypothetical protein
MEEAPNVNFVDHIKTIQNELLDYDAIFQTIRERLRNLIELVSPP